MAESIIASGASSEPPSTLSESAGASGNEILDVAKALLFLQEDMPSEDVRGCLGKAAHYLQKYAATRAVQGSTSESGHKPRQETPRLSLVLACVFGAALFPILGIAYFYAIQWLRQ